MSKFSRIILPLLVEMFTYIIPDKFSPKKTLDINSQKNLKNENVIKNNVIQKLSKRIRNKRALKITLILMSVTVGVQHFYPYLKAVLLHKIINEQSFEELNDPLKIFVKAVEDHNLPLHSKSIKAVLTTNKYSEIERVELLKIKLDFLINNELGGHTKFIIVSFVAAIIGLCISGVGGLSIVLQALHKLFVEGRISQEVYESLVEIAKN